MNDLKRKERIKKYLKDAGCDPALAGYSVLSTLIGLASDNPTYQYQDLIDEYLKVSGQQVSDKNHHRARRAARYCLVRSSSKITGVYKFVKMISVELD